MCHCQWKSLKSVGNYCARGCMQFSSNFLIIYKLFGLLQLHFNSAWWIWVICKFFEEKSLVDWSFREGQVTLFRIFRIPFPFSFSCRRAFPKGRLQLILCGLLHGRRIFPAFPELFSRLNVAYFPFLGGFSSTFIKLEIVFKYCWCVIVGEIMAL